MKGKGTFVTTFRHTKKMHKECGAKAQHIMEVRWME